MSHQNCFGYYFEMCLHLLQCRYGIKFRITLLPCQIVLKGAVSLLEMIEFYKSTCKLNLAYNSKIKIRGWQALSRTLKKVTKIILHCYLYSFFVVHVYNFVSYVKINCDRSYSFRLHVCNIWTCVTQCGQNKLFRCWDDL